MAAGRSGSVHRQKRAVGARPLGVLLRRDAWAIADARIVSPRRRALAVARRSSSTTSSRLG